MVDTETWNNYRSSGVDDETATIHGRDSAIEENLNQLKDLDDAIRDLISRRSKLVTQIREQNNRNSERVNISDDWFEGDLRGRPVPSRDMPSERPY